jgi:zinc transport system substrate-binding protein
MFASIITAERRSARLPASIVFSILLLSLPGCRSSTSHHANENQTPVYAGVPPLAFLVEQIGGRFVHVDSLVQPGQDPHTYEPTPQQILALGNAKLFFKIDMPFETSLLGRISAGHHDLIVVDATAGIQKRTIRGHACCRPNGDHDHSADGETLDPHVWLSPASLKIVAKNIATALGQADPKHRLDYANNLASLTDRIDSLDARVRKMLAPYRGRSFFVFHAGFGYFADAYGLKEEAVEVGGREPGPQQLRELIEEARSGGATTIFVQPQSAKRSAQVIADAIGGKVVTINGLDADVLRDIEDIAQKVETSFRTRNN